MGVTWGLAAALSFGVADYLVRHSGRREGSLRVVLYMQIVGLPASAFLYLLCGRLSFQPTVSSQYLAYLVLVVIIGLIITLGTVLLFRALTQGPLLATSPIASSFGAVTAALSIIAGEELRRTQSTGLVLTIVGIVLAVVASARAKEADQAIAMTRSSQSLVGIACAVGAAGLHGVGYWALRYVVPVLGNELPVLVMRATALVFMLILFRSRHLSVGLKCTRSVIPLLPIGMLDTAANWFYNLGIATGLTSVVSVVTSLFSVVTIVMGYLLLGERMTTGQWVGVSLTLIGIGLISI